MVWQVPPISFVYEQCTSAIEVSSPLPAAAAAVRLLLWWQVVTKGKVSNDELDGKPLGILLYLLASVFFLLENPMTLYHVSMALMSLMGLYVSPFCYALLLLDVRPPPRPRGRRV